MFLMAILLVLLSVHTGMQAAVELPDPNSYNYDFVDSTVYCVSPNFLGVESLREYKLALRLLKKDKDFIEYDALQQIGGFSYFVYNSNWPDGEFGSYMYEFDNGSRLAIYAKLREAGNQESYQEMQPENLMDMRFCYAEEPSQIMLDGICYCYTDGKLSEIAWENKTHEFELTLAENLNHLEPGDGTFIGELLNGRTAKTAIEQLERSIRLGLAVRKTQEVRLLLQWIAAGTYLVWGVLQLLNIPAEFGKKSVTQLEEDGLCKKYRRSCGILKLLLAAVFACMGFADLLEPVYKLAFLSVYALVLILVLVQQLLLNREYLLINRSREEYSTAMEAKRKFKKLGDATVKWLPILLLVLALTALMVYQIKLAAVPLPDGEEYTYGIYSRQVLSAYDLREYKTAIRQLRQDDAFVSYESLRRLGGLRKFVYESDWTKGEYGVYTYSFVDDADPVWRSSTLRICRKAYAESKKETADKVLKEYLVDMASGSGKDAAGNEFERLVWETDTHYFLLEYEPNGKVGDDAAVKAELEKLCRSIKMGLAVRKTREVRLLLQWIAAGTYLIWGVLQLLNIPAAFWKKRVTQLEEDGLCKKYRRSCGILKLLLAAVFGCMGFGELLTPVYMLAFLAVYALLLLSVLVQQLLLNKEFLP